MKHSWLVTLPRSVTWGDYQKELDAVRDYSQVMWYRVPRIPKELEIGDKLYITWRDLVRGFMYVTCVRTSDHSFTCTTTGAVWPAGNYIGRSGEFHHLAEADQRKVRGFRGIRKMEVEKHAMESQAEGQRG
jgi:hypothetical protein